LFHLLGSVLPNDILVEPLANLLRRGQIPAEIGTTPALLPRTFLASATSPAAAAAAASDADDVKVGVERRARRDVHGDPAAIPVVARRGAGPDSLPEDGVPGPGGGVVEEVGPDAADLDEGALERREDVGAEEVGAAAVGAEVERLVSAGGAGARGRRRRAPVGEEDVHVLGAARAVGLRADAARLGLVGGGGGGAAPGAGARGGGLPLAPLLEPPVRRRRRQRGGRGALGGGEGGGGARGGAGEATPPEEARHGGGLGVGADGWGLGRV